MITEHIQQAQDEETWIADLKAYLSGELDKLDADERRVRNVSSSRRSFPCRVINVARELKSTGPVES
ncbi:hypothetical protein PC129_g7076 [Phytophthora cactorum]|uniref:Uncharacterized protein n=1 Tax=Phytophthora cactorum TaxID=29920 RepID=A0A329S638_9STRA|nr:hypothetical protein Pcac1_g10261 [Phytophthora cactorum]KAG2829173.1 hypothetical protein PC111_g7882 [Phytophthora cactorum]KAG2838344.1 hypothetical protein PC112_g4545 [Phytophthora cactorum]KAG2861407.1 hypothetical protein PC113_g7199 [Phytophthora cactorum]KAG2915980.1 hypothetical protein PC114_g7642 [Phytophthora cactorum]